MKTDLNNDVQPEGDQLAKQPDRRDRQLLQDARGLQPRQARPQRQQNLNPRAADLCGELNFAPRPTLHIIINNKNLIFYRNPMQCWYL